MPLFDVVQGTIHNVRKLVRVLGLAIFAEALLRFLGIEPRGIAMRLLRRNETDHFAQMRVHGMFVDVKAIEFAVKIAADGLRFDTAEDTSFLECLASRGGGTAGITFDAALGKSPTSGASAHQQKFNAFFGNPITDGRYVGRKRIGASGPGDEPATGPAIGKDLGYRHSKLLEQSDAPGERSLAPALPGSGL